MNITLDQFFAAFFPTADEPIHLRAFKPRDAAQTADNLPVKIETTRNELHVSDELQQNLKGLNRYMGLYFVVNSGGDTDAAISKFNAFFVEADDLPIDEQHKRLDECALPPSLRVETKKSVHAYWLIDGECTAQDWREVQVRLIGYFGGDVKIKNPSRVMRIPYFNHLSIADGETQKKRVTVASFAPERRFTLEAMREAFPVINQAQKSEFTSGLFDDWESLNKEIRKRILGHPTCRVHHEWAKMRAVCHGGKSDSGLALNVATGAYFCQREPACSSSEIAVALGLPAKPNGLRIAGQVRPLNNSDEAVTDEPKARGKIYQAKDLREKLFDLYERGRLSGEHPGWDTLADLYTVARKQFTIVTGIPSHGKSSWLDNLLVNLAHRSNWKFAICSLENLPVENHLSCLIEIALNKPFNRGHSERMTKDDLERAIDWVHDRFYFVVPDENDCTISNLLEMIDELEVDGVVIDPMNEFEHRRPVMMSETEYVSQTLSKMRRKARDKNQHWWLVAHPTKLVKDKEGNYPVPTLYDISGCYAEDTEVLTFDGWKLHQEISMRDKIACFDLETGKTQWHSPESLTVADYEGEMYHFNGRSMDCLVTPSHRMVLKPGWNHTPVDPQDSRILKREWQFIQADQIKSSTWMMPYSAEFPDYTSDLNREPDIPELTQPNVDMIDDFLRFLGWWISEGCTQMGGLSFCQAEGELANEMEACLNRLGLNHHSAREVRSLRPDELPMYKSRIYKRSHTKFTEWVIRECKEGAPNKQLPKLTWLLSTRQKQILLDALIDGDGSRYESGNIKYSTTSKQLADDVQRLALETGHPSAIGFANGAEAHHLDRYTVYIGKRSRSYLTLHARQVDKVPYKGKVYCFTVPTGAYVTRRNGKVSFQGNSAHYRNKADMGIVVWRDTLQENSPTRVYVQKVRFRWCGKLGFVDLYYDISTGKYYESAPYSPYTTDRASDEDYSEWTNH